MRFYVCTIVFAFCCLSQIGYSAQTGSESSDSFNPYESFSRLPPDDDEIQQNNYPKSGSGPIYPPQE